MIRLVLFDLDGVLVDTCDWHYEALNMSLRAHCGFEISYDEHMLTFNGLPTRVKLEKLEVMEHKRGIVSVDKQKYFKEMVNSKLRLDMEKVSIMKLLRENRIKTGLVTNCIEETTKLMLNRIGVEEYLDPIITNEDVINSKPNHESYVTAMVWAGVDPCETVIVEDSPKGIEAATGLGAKVLRVQNAEEVTVSFIKENIL